MIYKIVGRNTQILKHINKYEQYIKDNLYKISIIKAQCLSELGQTALALKIVDNLIINL